MVNEQQKKYAERNNDGDGVQGSPPSAPLPAAAAVVKASPPSSTIKSPENATISTAVMITNNNNDESLFTEIPLEIEDGSIGRDGRGMVTSEEQQQQLEVLKRIKNWIKFAVILLLVLVIVFLVYLLRTQNYSDKDGQQEQQQQSTGPNGYNHYDGPYYETDEPYVDPYHGGGGGGWIEDDVDMESYMQAAERCNVPPYTGYLDLYPCHEIVPGHPNSFWYNELFLCRLSHRPCDGGVDYEHNPGDYDVMDLLLGSGDGNNGIIRVPVFDPGEVWLFATDKNGQPITQTSDSCHRRFYSEGYWRSASNFGDYNDYLFDSLICCEPENDDVRIFVVIDGVLVDSCPKKFSQNCRLC